MKIMNMFSSFGKHSESKRYEKLLQFILNVSLLVAVFETFRIKSIHSFELDIAHYLPTCGYSWHSFKTYLRYWKVSIYKKYDRGRYLNALYELLSKFKQSINVWFSLQLYLKKYGDKAKLLFTDTDSSLYEIEAENFYEDFYKNKKLFDFSKHSKNLKYYDKINDLLVGKGWNIWRTFKKFCCRIKSKNVLT